MLYCDKLHLASGSELIPPSIFAAKEVNAALVAAPFMQEHMTPAVRT